MKLEGAENRGKALLRDERTPLSSKKERKVFSSETSTLTTPGDVVKKESLVSD